MRSPLTFLLFLAHAIPALATDGVLEISQTCAMQTGCFAGDTAGLPVTIASRGSYRLTSNLTVPNENTDGIIVSASDVGIDLNNFAILGPVTCSGAPVICTPASGTGSGVERALETNRSISVKNGSITGMGAYGIQLGDQAEVTNLRVRWNRLDGIKAELGSTISRNTAFQNGREGIDADDGSTVSGNTGYANGTNGIFSGDGSTVSGNTAYANGGRGIWVYQGATVSGNTAFDNGGNGIEGSHGVTVSDNTVYNNNGDGICTTAGATVQRNTVRLNQGFGLNLGLHSTYRENTISSNTVGTVTGSGLNMGHNSCNGLTNCP